MAASTRHVLGGFHLEPPHTHLPTDAARLIEVILSEQHVPIIRRAGVDADEFEFRRHGINRALQRDLVADLGLNFSADIFPMTQPVRSASNASASGLILASPNTVRSFFGSMANCANVMLSSFLYLPPNRVNGVTDSTPGMRSMMGSCRAGKDSRWKSCSAPPPGVPRPPLPPATSAFPATPPAA